MQQIQELTIGQLAERSGCSVQIVRHYEESGLLPAPPRTGGNQRRYREDHLRRLQFIRHSRDLGFSLEEIREMAELADQPDQSCQAVDAIAKRHLQEVERRIEQLRALRKELKRMIGECGMGNVAQCRIIESLADFGHQHCHSHDHCGADVHEQVGRRRQR
jgi:Cu(I)-responsive transcriptional regulator